MTIRPDTTDYRQLLPVVEILLDGGVAAGPTQTYYGLMASADRAEAINRILAMKGRDSNKPLLLLLDRTERVSCYAKELPETAMGLVDRFWPGPLTMLFRARPGLHEALVGHTRTVGLRVEGLPIIQTLVRAMDRAVTGTSANPGGKKPARTVEEVQDYFGDKLDLIIDAGPCPGGPPSTLIDVSFGRPRLLRDGGLKINDMMAVAPDMRT
jgi:L-threonylcarbamoyladenylate synthase